MQDPGPPLQSRRDCKGGLLAPHYVGLRLYKSGRLVRRATAFRIVRTHFGRGAGDGRPHAGHGIVVPTCFDFISFGRN